MTDDTKNLFRKAALNSVSILGYVSTAVTFFPIGSLVRSYVLPLALVLIIVGVFRGAQSVIAEKNNEIKTAGKEKDAKIAEIRTQKDGEVSALNERVAQLSRKPYAEDLERNVRELLPKLSDEGRRMLLHLLKHAPIENGRSMLSDVPMERQQAQLQIARESGVVRGEQDDTGLRRAYWLINERFRPVLEDLLYE